MSTCMPAGTVIFGDLPLTLGLEVSGWSSVSSTSNCPYLMREAIRGVLRTIKSPINGHQAQSRALQGQSGAIRGNQRQSWGNPWQSVAISGNQWQSGGNPLTRAARSGARQLDR